MSDFLDEHGYVPPGTYPPKAGVAIIDNTTFPDGTALSPPTVPVIGQRFTLIGKTGAGSGAADNTGNVYVGSYDPDGQIVLLAPGDTGAINLIMPDNGICDLRNYYASGADEDGVQWLRAN